MLDNAAIGARHAHLVALHRKRAIIGASCHLNGYSDVSTGFSIRRKKQRTDATCLAIRKKSVELQDEAIAIAIELGMKPLLERVLAQREILKA